MSEPENTSVGGNAGKGAADPLSGWTTKQANGITRLRLSAPVKTAEGDLTELEVRPPLGKHVRAMDTSSEDPAQFLVFAEDLCELTRNQIDNLPAADAMRLVALIGVGFGDGMTAGTG